MLSENFQPGLIGGDMVPAPRVPLTAEGDGLLPIQVVFAGYAPLKQQPRNIAAVTLGTQERVHDFDPCRRLQIGVRKQDPGPTSFEGKRRLRADHPQVLQLHFGCHEDCP